MGAIEALREESAARVRELEQAEDRVAELSSRVTRTPRSFTRQRAIQDLEWAKAALAERRLLAAAAKHALDRALRIEAR